MWARVINTKGSGLCMPGLLVRAGEGTAAGTLGANWRFVPQLGQNLIPTATSVPQLWQKGKSLEIVLE
jgi:hypothetical protein